MKLVLILKCDICTAKAAVCLYHEPKCVCFSFFSAAFALIATKRATLLIIRNLSCGRDLASASMISWSLSANTMEVWRCVFPAATLTIELILSLRYDRADNIVVSLSVIVCLFLNLPCAVLGNGFTAKDQWWWRMSVLPRLKTVYTVRFSKRRSREWYKGAWRYGIYLRVFS